MALQGPPEKIRPSGVNGMKKARRQALEKRGFKITQTQEFLGLSDEDMALIDLKIQLIRKLREVRLKRGITQTGLAKMMQTSQSRIAMLEGGSSDVSLDLVCRALFTLGVSKKELATTISAKRAA